MWAWQNEDGSTQNFYDAESFRQVVEEQHIEEELRALLPRPEGKPIEKPAEAGLRERMCAHIDTPPFLSTLQLLCNLLDWDWNKLYNESFLNQQAPILLQCLHRYDVT